MKKLERTLTLLFSLGTLTFVIGCGNSQQSATSGTNGNSQQPAYESDGHSHGAGPHDGTVVDWGGGKFHVELTVNHEKQEATVFILGDDERTPSPIKAEEIQLSISDPAIQFTLKAAPQEGDPEGSASRFVGSHESLGVAQEYAGTITGVVNDTPYSGDFEEEPHGDHDHH